MTSTADVAVALTANPSPVTAGTNITYDVTVTNNGPGPADNVTMTDAVPAGATFVSETQLSGPAFTGDPHGIWATGDGSRLFVGRESANHVSVIDTGKPNDPADDRVIATVDVGKQPIDVVVSSHPSVVGP